MKNLVEEKYFEFISYFVLVSVLSICMFFYVILGTNTLYKIYTIGVMSIFYSLWGIIHARIEGRLVRKVILEYLLISLLVFALAYFSLRTY